MALPKLTHPMIDVVVPSTNKKIKVRPMLVKEEKILLMAKTSEQVSDMLSALKQVVNNCVIDSDVDVEKLALFDIEYLFLKIRSVSVDNVTKVSYRDNEDTKVYDFEIDLDEVKVKFPEKIEKNIAINDTMGVIMKYPDASLYSDKEFMESNEENLIDNLVSRCIDKVYEGDEMIDLKNYSADEIKEFIDSFDVNTYDKMRKFFNNLPTLYYKIEYKNSNGNERSIEMTSLSDFFTLR